MCITHQARAQDGSVCCMHSITSSLVTSLVTSQPLILCYQARNAAWLETRSTKRSMQRSTKRAPRFERDAQLTRTRFARNEAHASSETRPTLRARHATEPRHATERDTQLTRPTLRARMQRTRCDTSEMATANVCLALNHAAHLRPWWGRHAASHASRRGFHSVKRGAKRGV